MNITPRVPGDITIMARKVLVFITNKEDGSTDPGDPYLFISLEIIVIFLFILLFFLTFNSDNK